MAIERQILMDRSANVAAPFISGPELFQAYDLVGVGLLACATSNPRVSDAQRSRTESREVRFEVYCQGDCSVWYFEGYGNGMRQAVTDRRSFTFLAPAGTEVQLAATAWNCPSLVHVQIWVDGMLEVSDDEHTGAACRPYHAKAKYKL